MHPRSVMGLASALLVSLASFPALVACSGAAPEAVGGAAPRPDTQSESDGSVTADGAAGPAALDAGADATPTLTGDVWVDAKGAVVGLSRTIPDQYGESVIALVDKAGLSWRVEPSRGTVSSLDSRGSWYYEGPDCTGKRWLGDGVGLWLGSARPGVTATLASDYSTVLAPKPAAVAAQLPKTASIDDPSYGCRPSSYGAQNPYGYAESDVLEPVAPTGFAAPFHIERH